MALPIERWARQAVLLKAAGDPLPMVADKRVLADVNDLAMLNRLEWRERQRLLRVDGKPMALEGMYTGLNCIPPPGDLTTKTAISGEVGLMTAAEIALYLPFIANGVSAPEAFELAITGAYTSSTTPGNLTITPRMGTTTSGITLGPTGANALTASITTGGWAIDGRLTIRTIGMPGANSTALFFGHFYMSNAAMGAASIMAIDTVMGHTLASFDSTSPSAATGGGIFFGFTHTVTTVTYIPRQVHWGSWN